MQDCGSPPHTGAIDREILCRTTPSVKMKGFPTRPRRSERLGMQLSAACAMQVEGPDFVQILSDASQSIRRNVQCEFANADGESGGFSFP